ncbi:MAG: dTDP-4-dehydrorhamnose reductase [Lacibacter sp.]
MKVLVTGANGLLGQHLIRRLVQEAKFQIHATGKGPSRLAYGPANGVHYHEVDLTQFRKVEQLITQVAPQIIIHAAAITQPNDCAADATTCWKVNVGATRALVKAARAINSYLIYVSTDFVFDGEDGPYDEAAQPNPVNTYGESKLLAEKIVAASGLPWAIVRTVLVYGERVPGGRNNFVLWVQQQLEKGKAINVVADQWRTPTFADDLARGILLVLLKHARGIYHISGKEGCSPYELARKVAALLGKDAGLIHPVTAETFREPARRPLKTGFTIEKATKELGFVPLPLHEGLQRTLGLV